MERLSHVSIRSRLKSREKQVCRNKLLYQGVFQSAPGSRAGRNVNTNVSHICCQNVSIRSRLKSREKRGSSFLPRVLWRFNPLPAQEPGETKKSSPAPALFSVSIRSPLQSQHT